MSNESDVRAGGAFVELGMDDADYKKKSQAAKGSLKDLGKELLKIGTGLIAAGAAIQLAINKCLELFGIEQKAEAQLMAVIRSTKGVAGVTFDAAKELAAGFQQVTTYEDDAILSAESLLLTFTAIGKDIFPMATEAILDMSTALGQDLSSSTIRIGKALQDPILGMTALRRVGVNFTKEQQATVGQLVKTGNKLAAQKFILKELNTEFGGSARAAAGTYAGSTQQLNNAIGDLKETIGSIWAPLKQATNAWLKGWVEAVNVYLKQHPQLIAGLYKLSWYFLAIGGAISALGGFLLWVTSPIAVLITLAIVMTAVFLEAFGLIDLGIGDLADSFKIGTMTIRGHWEAFWQYVLMGFQSLWAGVLKMTMWTVDKLSGVIDPIADTWVTLMKNTGFMSGEDYEEYWKKREEGGGSMSENAIKGLAHMREEAMRGIEGSLGAVEDIKVTHKNPKKPFFKGSILPGVRPFDELGDVTTSTQAPKMSVTGFMGSSRASQQVGAAFGATDVNTQQLRTQQNMLSTLQNIEQNTRGAVATYS